MAHLVKGSLLRAVAKYDSYVTWRHLCGIDPLEKGMVIPSSILA